MIEPGYRCMESLLLGLGAMAIAAGIGACLTAARSALLRRSLRAADREKKEERSKKHD